MSHLELRRVSTSCGAGATGVLTLVDVAAERGSFVAVVVLSGSGKSALLTVTDNLGG